MPSPFPGMDPYLEHPEFFPGLHDRMTSYVSEDLQNRLPRDYYADLRQRVWIEHAQRAVLPDVAVLGASAPRQELEGADAAVAVVTEDSAQPVVIRAPQGEMSEPFVEIYTTRGGKRLVTSIELLSLSNKTPGEFGRDLYQQKQRELLHSKVHLVEIDLLRGGTHATAVPCDRLRRGAGPFDYHVCIRRFHDPEHFLIYPIRLAQRLPEIPIPLLPDDGQVAIDLQPLFDRCYDAGPYRRIALYEEIEPEPPLSDEQRRWATRRLLERGLLKANGPRA